MDDVFEIIKMFLSSSCQDIQDSEIQAQLSQDWLEALDAGKALRRKMIDVVAKETSKNYLETTILCTVQERERERVRKVRKR